MHVCVRLWGLSVLQRGSKGSGEVRPSLVVSAVSGVSLERARLLLSETPGTIGLSRAGIYLVPPGAFLGRGSQKTPQEVLWALPLQHSPQQVG